MTVSLSPELQRFVEEQVRDGKFATVDDAVAEAVRRMKAREEKLQSLRREVQAGLDQVARSQVDEWNAEDTKERLRDRAAIKSRRH